jgi:predicted RNA-binding protein with PUA-like domain
MTSQSTSTQLPTYFLAKSEPSTYSIDDLEHDQVTTWDGVHNYQAINFIKAWKPGDYVFLYHSQGQNSITGLAKVVSQPIKDPNDSRNISWIADLQFVRKYPEQDRVTLKQVKDSGLFNDFWLVRNSRLSVMQCPDDFVQWIAQSLPIT